MAIEVHPNGRHDKVKGDNLKLLEEGE